MIYQHAGKCDDQQNLKDILDAAMVSTPEEVTYEITSLPMTSTPVKKPSARKSLCLFTKILNVKKRIAKRRVGATKSNFRAMNVGTRQWTNKRNEKRIQISMRISNVIYMHR